MSFISRIGELKRVILALKKKKNQKSSRASRLHASELFPRSQNSKTNRRTGLTARIRLVFFIKKDTLILPHQVKVSEARETEKFWTTNGEEQNCEASR